MSLWLSVAQEDGASCHARSRTVVAFFTIFVALSCITLLVPLPYFSFSAKLRPSRTEETRTLQLQPRGARSVQQQPQKALPLGIPASFKGGKFFIYNGSEFDFSKTLECYRRFHKGKNIWENEIRDTVQDTGEIWLYRSLLEHPNRTFDPEEADLFYVPTYIATSFRMKTACKSTHFERMMNVTVALTQSPYWHRRHGADHLFVCGWWKCGDALEVLRDKLDVGRTSILTTMERHKPWSSWKCPERIVAHPYVANHEITKNFSNTPFAERSTSFFFVGCSRYQKARKNIEVLESLNSSYVKIQADCRFMVGPEQYAHAIQNAQFCLVPRGDTFTSRRLFDAVAAGCIPIIQNGGIQRSLPFRWKLKYREFALFAPTRVFENSTRLLDYCTQLLDRPVEEFERMHRALLSIRNDLVWGQGSPFGVDARIGNVGDNIIYEAMYKSSQLQLKGDKLMTARCLGDWPDP